MWVDDLAAVAVNGGELRAMYHEEIAAVLAKVDSLTPREFEILTLLPCGDGTRALAHRLGISERTAKAHVGRVVRKLGATSRTTAAIAAFVLLSARTRPGGKR